MNALNKPNRSLFRFTYKHIVKPILFRRLPDDVHHRMIRSGSLIQKVPVVRSFSKLLSHQSDRLNIDVAGINFRNPIGLSAGLDKGIDLPLVMKNIGFGWMTGGSVTSGVYEGNPRPWFRRLPEDKALLINAGLPSEGVDVVADRVGSYKQSIFDNFHLNVSVAKTNSKFCASDDVAIDDYCQSLAKFDQIDQVRFLEINISCPNTFGGEPFTKPAKLEELLSKVDKLNLTKPVFVKMPLFMNWSEFDELLIVITKHKIAGVAIANLLKDRDKADLKNDLPNDAPGGLSGLPTKQYSNDLIAKTYKKYGEKIAIIGIGGVFTAEDAYEKIRSGASLVALITGLIYQGPQSIGEINYGLDKLLERDEYSSVAEAVGVDVV